MFFCLMQVIRAKAGVLDREILMITFVKFTNSTKGTPWYVVYEGEAAGHFMRKLGYDAFALGNHEFDNGVEVCFSRLVYL